MIYNMQICTKLSKVPQRGPPFKFWGPAVPPPQHADYFVLCRLSLVSFSLYNRSHPSTNLLMLHLCLLHHGCVCQFAVYVKSMCSRCQGNAGVRHLATLFAVCDYGDLCRTQAFVSSSNFEQRRLSWQGVHFLHRPAVFFFVTWFFVFFRNISAIWVVRSPASVGDIQVTDARGYRERQQRIPLSQFIVIVASTTLPRRRLYIVFVLPGLTQSIL